MTDTQSDHMHAVSFRCAMCNRPSLALQDGKCLACNMVVEVSSPRKPRRITKSRDPILAGIYASLNEALDDMRFITIAVDGEEWDRGYLRIERLRKAAKARADIFRPKRIRKAERRAGEIDRIIRYVAAQPAGFRNHVSSTGVSISNAERAAHYRSELIEWRLFTQHGIGLRKQFIAAHRDALQWARFHRLVAAECGRRLP